MRFRATHLSVPRAGEKENGDAVLIRRDDEGRSLFALVDALGHGASAASVAKAAVQKLQTLSLALPVRELMIALHEELKGSIGAAATLCVLDEERLAACAVGNVQLVAEGFELPLIPCAGVLGHRVVTFRACACELRSPAWIALFSDGISQRPPFDELSALTLEAACKTCLNRFRIREDDATLLLARIEEDE